MCPRWNFGYSALRSPRGRHDKKMNSILPLPPDTLTSAAPTASDAGHWPAHLHLQFARTLRGTRLTRKQHAGPLYVQRPFYPEGAELAHVYLLHPPGGLVSGDTLALRLQLENSAQVLATTPGAGRVYRARTDRRTQRQHNVLQLDAGTSLEWLPQESIIYPGAHAHLQTCVDMIEGARFSGWEITVLGLPASNEPLQDGSLLQQLEIRLQGRPVLRERLLLDDASRALATARIGLQGATVSGVFVSGPFSDAELRELALPELQKIKAEASRPALCGITRLGVFLVARYLGNCAQQARQLFTLYWQILRPLLLQRAACPPAIWIT